MLEIRSNGMRSRVILEGKDISNELSRVTINFEAGEIPVAELYSTQHETSISIDEAVVKWNQPSGN